MNTSESKSLDTGSWSSLQDDFVSQSLSKQELNEEKAKTGEAGSREQRPFWEANTTVAKMYRSKNDQSQ